MSVSCESELDLLGEPLSLSQQWLALLVIVVVLVLETETCSCNQEDYCLPPPPPQKVEAGWAGKVEKELLQMSTRSLWR